MRLARKTCSINFKKQSPDPALFFEKEQGFSCYAWGVETMIAEWLEKLNLPDVMRDTETGRTVTAAGWERHRKTGGISWISGNGMAYNGRRPSRSCGGRNG